MISHLIKINRKLILFIRHLKRRHLPSDLILSVTYRCNAKCKMCYYWQSLNTGADEFTINELKKVSLSLGNFEYLLLTGGEPFLRDDLVDICTLFSEQNHIKKIHLPTNGLLTDKIYQVVPIIAEKCKNVTLYVLLTLQGLEKTHDEITGIKGGFQSVLAAAKKLNKVKQKHSNLFVYMNTVVCNKNYHEVERLLDFVKSNLNVDFHSLCLMRGIPRESNFSPPSANKWIELTERYLYYHHYYLSNAKKLQQSFVFSDFWERYKNRVFAGVLEKEKLPFRCLAGDMIGVIEPNLDVRLCELTPVIGNLRDVDYDFKAIWFSNKAAEQRRKIQYCACTHECFIIPSIIYNPWQYIKSHILWRWIKKP